MSSDVGAFVRANLPAPPARILEVGAGDGELAATLTEAGYDVVAIDPDPRGANVRGVALLELDEPPSAFDAAVAVVSLHHIEPLAESLHKLGGLLRPGAVLVVDEFDVARFDPAAARWWLEQRRSLGAEDGRTGDELVTEYRAHLHPLGQIIEALEEQFEIGTPIRGAYFYRWGLDESFRPKEESLIARGGLPAVGARFVAQRTTASPTRTRPGAATAP
jgi:SAM-dependent methyltransferase